MVGELASKISPRPMTCRHVVFNLMRRRPISKGAAKMNWLQFNVCGFRASADRQPALRSAAQKQKHARQNQEAGTASRHQRYSSAENLPVPWSSKIHTSRLRPPERSLSMSSVAAFHCGQYQSCTVARCKLSATCTMNFRKLVSSLVQHCRNLVVQGIGWLAFALVEQRQFTAAEG